MHPTQNRSNRLVCSWLQRDKLSAAGLHTLPGPETSLTSAEFSEGAAASLCLPSPACAEQVGQVIRGAQVVDLYGEAVQCNITIGDLYRKKHDTFKMRLFQMFGKIGRSFFGSDFGTSFLESIFQVLSCFW